MSAGSAPATGVASYLLERAWVDGAVHDDVRVERVAVAVGQPGDGEAGERHSFTAWAVKLMLMS